jgi:hypothetical protein
MKRSIIVLALITFVLTACGQRNLDTPADRLVGHWSTSTESGDDLYFSKVNSDDVGSYILVQFDGNTARHKYKIVSQIPAGERVIVQLWFSDGTKRIDEYMISKDGMELESTFVYDGMELTSGLKYVDDKIEP